MNAKLPILDTSRPPQADAVRTARDKPALQLREHHDLSPGCGEPRARFFVRLRGAVPRRAFGAWGSRVSAVGGLAREVRDRSLD